MSDIYSTIVLQNLKLDILGMVKVKYEHLETAENMVDHLLNKLDILLAEHGLNVKVCWV